MPSASSVTADGTRVQELAVGDSGGRAARSGDRLLIDYVLRRANGYFIYSTVEGVSFQPADVPVGPVEVVLVREKVFFFFFFFSFFSFSFVVFFLVLLSLSLSLSPSSLSLSLSLSLFSLSLLSPYGLFLFPSFFVSQKKKISSSGNRRPRPGARLGPRRGAAGLQAPRVCAAVGGVRLQGQGEREDFGPAAADVRLEAAAGQPREGAAGVRGSGAAGQRRAEVKRRGEEIGGIREGKRKRE